MEVTIVTWAVDEVVVHLSAVHDVIGTTVVVTGVDVVVNSPVAADEVVGSVIGQ